MVGKRKNSMCIICYKSATTPSSQERTESDELKVSKQKLFLLLLRRHLKLHSKTKLSDDVAGSEFLCCEDCFQLGHSFCDLYFQLDCIKLQLNWKLRRIQETMLCAGRVPSRFNAFRRQFEPGVNEEDDDAHVQSQQIFSEIEKLRKDLIKHSKQKLCEVLPKVCVKRTGGEAPQMKIEKVSPKKGNFSGSFQTHLEASLWNKFELLAALLTYVAVLHLSLPLNSSEVPNENYLGQNISLEDLELTSGENPDEDHQDERISIEEESLLPDSVNEADDVNSVDEAVENDAENDTSSITFAENCTSFQLGDNVSVEEEHDVDNEQKDVFIHCDPVEMNLDVRQNAVPLSSSSPKHDADASNQTIFTVSLTEELPMEPTSLLANTRKSLRALFNCTKCSKTFTNHVNLNLHLKTHDELESSEESSESELDDDQMEVDFQPNGGDSEISESEMELSQSYDESADEETATVKKEKDDSPAERNSEKDEKLENSCDQCPLVFNNVEELEKHYYTAHPDPSTWQIVCKMEGCGCRFPTPRGLDLHLAYAHTTKKVRKRLENVQKTKPSKTVTFNKAKKKKTSSASSTLPHEDVLNKPINLAEEIVSNKDEQLHQFSPEECELCQEKFSCEAAVEKHRALDHNLSNYVRCQTCGKMYGSRYSLLQHVRVKRNPFLPQCFKNYENVKFRCEFPNPAGSRANQFCPRENCYEAFSGDRHLEIHLKTHGNWDCASCPTKFSKAHEFAYHELTDHNPNKPLGETVVHCSRCKEFFPSSHILVAHFLYEHLAILPKFSFPNTSKMKRLQEEDYPHIPSSSQSHVQKKKWRWNHECGLCDQRFRCEGEVEKHRVQNHQQYRCIRCHSCKRKFESRRNLRKHLHLDKFQECLARYKEDKVEITPLKFPVQEIFKPKVYLFCPHAICYEVFQHEELLQVHLKTHGNWECMLCPEKFSKAHKFALHEICEHNPNKELRDDEVMNTRKPGNRLPKALENMVLHCTRCRSSFKDRDSILTHFLHAHLDIPEIPIAIPKNDNGKARLQCKICQRVFLPNATEESLKKHFQLVHNVEGMDPSLISTCSICKAPFTKRNHLTTHLRVAHRQTITYKCPHCDKQLKDPVQLRGHVARKHEGKTSGLKGAFECDICKEKFMTKRILERHLTGHTNNDKSEFKCEICAATFAKKVRLWNHNKNMHKPPKCSQTCETCGKVFKNTTKLKQHQSYTHTDPSEWKFECPEEGCGKRCWSKQKLTEHIRTHTKECPFVCHLCREAYRFRQYLRSHLKKVHGATAAKTLPARSYRKPFDQTVRDEVSGANLEDDDSDSTSE